MRRAIVFHLISVAEGNAPIEEIDGTGTDMTNLAQLRTRAKEASAETSERRSSEAQQTYFERSAVIRIYAVARAEGKCEACGNPAPFIDSSGKPFLEVHHIRRLTDGGPDIPDGVAAICSNCHREAHHGQRRAELTTWGAEWSKAVRQRAIAEASSSAKSASTTKN
jgi:5-methylcytosine-specific restriction protein A